MSRLSPDKKFYIILSVVIFFGLAILALVSWSVMDQRNKTNSMQGSQSAAEDQSKGEREAAQKEDKVELYNQCIDTSNKLYDEYMAKIPTDLSFEEYNVYRQTLKDTRDNQKADCDRRYKD